MVTVRVNDFNYQDFYKKVHLLPRPGGNPHGRQKKKYVNLVCAFDIETTRLADIEESFMYIWQFQIDDYYTVYGRTWDEFLDFLTRLQRRLRGGMLVVYIHNASYEWQFLRGIYDFEEDEVFATEPRKILKFTMFDSFEFRCSYLQTNMSLDQFLKKMGVKHKKLTYDYDKIRYSDTVLTDDELEYCLNDVRGLVEALKVEMQTDGDNLYTIPLTSTGYPRRDCKNAMDGYNHKQLAEMLPDLKIYKLLRMAFRGGNTHANRYFSNQILKGVRSYDMASAYPAVMSTCLYPMGKFYEERACTPERLHQLIFKRKRAVLMRIAFWGLKLKDEFDGCPYISRDKCSNLYRGTFDNGRVLEADYLELGLTDLDFKIILKHYDWTASNILECYHAKYKPLPKMIRDVVKEYYEAKTRLKGVEGQEVYYTKAKNKLNSLYGMSAQDPVKDSCKFRDGEFIYEDEDSEKLLEKANKKAFQAYQWGVWTTAWCRTYLQEGIDLVQDQMINGEKNYGFVYCDTDSVKFIGDVDFSELNKIREKRALDAGAWAEDPHGEAHFMGVYETDGDYSRFKTMGAKKYAYEEEDGSLHITIAGVSKKAGAKELGKLENMVEGFTFYAAGGTESVYNDNMDTWIERDGHMIRITDNIVIRPSTYTLGLTAEYAAILAGCIDIAYSDHDIPGLYRLKRH